MYHYKTNIPKLKQCLAANLCQNQIGLKLDPRVIQNVKLKKKTEKKVNYNLINLFSITWECCDNALSLWTPIKLTNSLMNTTVILNPKFLPNFPSGQYLRGGIFHCRWYRFPQKPRTITANATNDAQSVGTSTVISIFRKAYSLVSRISSNPNTYYTKYLRNKLHIVNVDVAEDMNRVGPFVAKGNALGCKLKPQKGITKPRRTKLGFSGNNMERSGPKIW